MPSSCRMIAAAISLTLVRHAAVACRTTSEYMSFNGWCIKRDMYTRTLSPARDIAAGQHNQRETCCGAAIATCALAFEFPECSDVWSGWKEVSGNNAATFYKKQISRRCSGFRLRAHARIAAQLRRCGSLQMPLPSLAGR